MRFSDTDNDHRFRPQRVQASRAKRGSSRADALSNVPLEREGQSIACAPRLERRGDHSARGENGEIPQLRVQPLDGADFSRRASFQLHGVEHLARSQSISVQTAGLEPT